MAVASIETALGETWRFLPCEARWASKWGGKMRVLYLHFPRFPIQRRVAEMPSLAGKPIVLSEEKRNQRKVAFASTAALTAGIRAGMTVTAATALIPSLEEFPYRLEEERNALLSLGEALLSIAPAFQ